MSDAPVPVIFVTGRDPRSRLVDSHTGYVRAHAHAARRAGYQTHVVCLGPESARTETAYATVHVVKSPTRYVRQVMIPFVASALSSGVVRVFDELGGRNTILHGFGVWGYAMARAAARIREGGQTCVAILGSYTTYLDETQSQWRGLASRANLAAYVKYGVEQAWIRLMVSRYERHGYQTADRVLVNYRSVAKLVASRFGAGVPCGVTAYTIEQEFEGPPPARHPRRAGAPPALLTISRSQPRKGIDVLIDALRLLKLEGLLFRARILGSGPLIETYRDQVRASGLADCVEMPGWVDDIEPDLAEADIFVLPSREEQSGSLAVLEAMRMGIPCVSSACDGMPEDIRHGDNGLLAEPGDPGSLATALRKLIRNPADRERIGKAGRASFEARFSGPAFTRALDGIYREMLAVR
jgi:glycosyltransferase involved in cell wall biosynthesis